jgi:hypothetical protein
VYKGAQNAQPIYASRSLTPDDFAHHLDLRGVACFEMEVQMKDADLRAVILQKLYDARNEGGGYVLIHNLKEVAPVGIGQLANVFEELQQHGLISWKHAVGPEGPAGIGKITARGVDVVEDYVVPPVAINIQDHSVKVTGSPKVQIGNANFLHAGISIQKIHAAIDKSNASSEEKTEAKFLWTKITNNATFSTVVAALPRAAGPAH